MFLYNSKEFLRFCKYSFKAGGVVVFCFFPSSDFLSSFSSLCFSAFSASSSFVKISCCLSIISLLIILFTRSVSFCFILSIIFCKSPKFPFPLSPSFVPSFTFCNASRMACCFAAIFASSFDCPDFPLPFFPLSSFICSPILLI